MFYKCSGIISGKYLVMQSSETSATSSIITGGMLLASDDCYMRYWLSLEGESDSGSIMIGGENIVTGIVNTFYESQPWMFPQRAFGFQRYILHIPRMGGPGLIRIVIKGNDNSEK